MQWCATKFLFSWLCGNEALNICRIFCRISKWQGMDLANKKLCLLDSVLCPHDNIMKSFRYWSVTVEVLFYHSFVRPQTTSWVVRTSSSIKVAGDFSKMKAKKSRSTFVVAIKHWRDRNVLKLNVLVLELHRRWGSCFAGWGDARKAALPSKWRST